MSASASITAPLAALTTIFTPPCSTSWLLTTSDEPSQFPAFPTSGPASCDPPGWAANIRDKGFEYYSPAICPSGFQVGSSCQIAETRTSDGFPAIASGETAAYCVPSGQSCTSDVTDFRGGTWGVTSDGDDDGAFTVGPALQIRFQQSDLSTLETHPLTPGLTLSSVGSSPSTAAESGSSSTPESTSTMDAMVVTPASSPASATATQTASGSTSASLHSITSETPTDNGRPVIAAIVAVIAVVVPVAVVVGALWAFRRYKIRRREGLPFWPFFSKPADATDMAETRAGPTDNLGSRPVDEENTPAAEPSRYDDVPRINLPDEFDARFTVPTTETEFGSEENPAELEANDEMRSSLRESWISRMLSRVARSSTATRSTSRSRWTQRSFRMTEGWDKPISEHLEVPEIPEGHLSRPTTSHSTPSHNGGITRAVSMPPQLPKVRTFDRLSSGTFGPVIKEKPDSDAGSVRSL